MSNTTSCSHHPFFCLTHTYTHISFRCTRPPTLSISLHLIRIQVIINKICLHVLEIICNCSTLDIAMYSSFRSTRPPTLSISLHGIKACHSLIHSHVFYCSPTTKHNQLNDRGEKWTLRWEALFPPRNSTDRTLHRGNTRCTNTLSMKAIGATLKEFTKINPTQHMLTIQLGSWRRVVWFTA